MQASFLRTVFLVWVSLLPMTFPTHANEEAPLIRRTIRASLLYRADQYILLDYLSVGCWHRVRYRFRYEPLPSPRIKAWQETPVWKTDRRGKKRLSGRAWQYLAAITLNREQVALFDSMLACYRKPGRATSTTSRRIALKQYEGGKSLIVEQYRDDNLRTTLREDASPQDRVTLGIPDDPILSLSQVYRLALEASRKKRPTVPYVPAAPRSTYASVKARITKEILRERQEGQQFLETLPDYDLLRAAFIVQHVRLSGELRSTLVARHPGVVDNACWTVPYAKRPSNLTAETFLTAFAATEKAVSSHRWIQAWKRKGMGRTVEADILGASPLGEPREKIENAILPAWQHAGFSGVPTYHVLLRRPGNTWIQLYLGDKEARALAVYCLPPQSPEAILHPADRLDLFYFVGETIPKYAVIFPDGTVQVNTRPE